MRKTTYTTEEIIALLQKLAEQLHLEVPTMPSPERRQYAEQLAQRTQEVAERIRNGEHSHSNGREFAAISHLIDDGIMVSPRREFNETYDEVGRAFKKWDADFFAAQRASQTPPTGE